MRNFISDEHQRLHQNSLKWLYKANGTQTHVKYVIQSLWETQVWVIQRSHLFLLITIQPGKDQISQYDLQEFLLCCILVNAVHMWERFKWWLSYFIGTVVHSLLTAWSFNPSRTKRCRALSIIWNPVRTFSLLFSLSLLISWPDRSLWIVSSG